MPNFFGSNRRDTGYRQSILGGVAGLFMGIQQMREKRRLQQEEEQKQMAEALAFKQGVDQVKSVAGEDTAKWLTLPESIQKAFPLDQYLAALQEKKDRENPNKGFLFTPPEGGDTAAGLPTQQGPLINPEDNPYVKEIEKAAMGGVTTPTAEGEGKGFRGEFSNWLIEKDKSGKPNKDDIELKKAQADLYGKELDNKIKEQKLDPAHQALIQFKGDIEGYMTGYSKYLSEKRKDIETVNNKIQGGASGFTMAMRKNPDDPASYRTFGDWLGDQGVTVDTKKDLVAYNAIMTEEDQMTVPGGAPFDKTGQAKHLKEYSTILFEVKPRFNSGQIQSYDDLKKFIDAEYKNSADVDKDWLDAEVYYGGVKMKRKEAIKRASWLFIVRDLMGGE